MTFEVKDFSDILRITESHPEWRRKLRRALFPEIDVPRALQKLAEAHDRMDAAIERLTIQLETGFAETAAGFTEAAAERKVMKQDTQDLATRMETGFTEASAERKTLRQDVNKLRQDVGTLKGLSHEQFYQFKSNAIFGRYLKRGQEATEWVADQLQEAQKAGKISYKAFDQVMAADLLWRGQLRTTGAEVILVIEASWFAEPNDMERAIARAAVLRDLGLKALPVVAGREWTEGLPELARQQGVVLTANGRVDKASWQAALS